MSGAKKNMEALFYIPQKNIHLSYTLRKWNEALSRPFLITQEKNNDCEISILD